MTMMPVTTMMMAVAKATKREMQDFLMEGLALRYVNKGLKYARIYFCSQHAEPYFDFSRP